MTELREILYSFLIMLLQFSESHQVPYIFAAEGENVTLPCDKVESGQEQCQLTTWIHETFDTKKDVALISLGEVGTNIAQRVKLTKECSLLLNNVRTQEAGRYTCRQYSSWGHEDFRNSLISLSIVSLNKVTKGSQTELQCSVSTNLRCTNVEVKWLDGDAAVAKTHPHLRVTKSSCCSSVHVPKSHISLGQNLSCEVIHDDKKYRYRPRAEEHETTQEEQSTLGDNNDRGDSETRTESGLKRWWWAVTAPIVVLLLAFVIFVTWRRAKRKTREPGSPPSAEEGVSYASVSFNKSHKKTVMRANEETVIYSPVRSAASVDPAQLYASVNKNK